MSTASVNRCPVSMFSKSFVHKDWHCENPKRAGPVSVYYFGRGISVNDDIVDMFFVVRA